jgi:hypothetical protein
MHASASLRTFMSARMNWRRQPRPSKAFQSIPVTLVSLLLVRSVQSMQEERFVSSSIAKTWLAILQLWATIDADYQSLLTSIS